jgi:hypothetical protein
VTAELLAHQVPDDQLPDAAQPQSSSTAHGTRAHELAARPPTCAYDPALREALSELSNTALITTCAAAAGPAHPAADR